MSPSVLLCPHVKEVFATVLVEAIQVVEVRVRQAVEGSVAVVVAISSLRLCVQKLGSVRELDSLREAGARALLVLEPNTTRVPLTLALLVATSVMLVLAMALCMFVVVLVALLLMAALVHVLLLREVSGPEAIV